MRPVLFLLLVPALHALAAQPFAERYALATDRAAVLKELIPGTQDYYFYHALYHQTQGDQQKAAALLKEWEEASSGPNGRRDLLKNRAALLGYAKDPAGTLAWLQEKLSLEFNHQRQTEEARAELVSTLDPALISFEAFQKQALEGTEYLSKVTDAGLYRLTQPVEKWKLTEIRALLERLKRPDFPGLVGIIHRELKEKDAKFGNFPIHTLLTSAQLAELQKLRPALINSETFTTAVMTRMRPTEFDDPDRDPAVRGAWLERLWAYAATLNPNANALKANLLYHLLAHDERQGKLDPQRLLAYLKLPRPVRYISAQYQKDHPDLWKFPAALDFDPSAFTGNAPVGDDEALVRRLLIRYLTTEKQDAIAPLISAGFLNDLLAEAKLTTGAEQPQKWMSLLSPESLQSLKDRTDIEFDPATPNTWAPDASVKLDVWVKNAPSLLVRIYEINTANVHRTGEEVSTALDLDGLTANHEHKLDLNTAPILRTKQTFTFPELSAPRGVWIVEFIGNGKASRALIRKGGLRTIVRQTSAGTAVTVLDEKLKPVPAAFAMVGPKQFKADDKGLILLPLSTQPGPQQVILDDGNGFTALESIELQGEKYELGAGFHVPRESLLPGNKATLLVRPRLTSNGRPVLLESLEKVKVTIASQTLDGTPATVVIPIEKLAEDKETTVEFTVPDRLKALKFLLTAEVKSDLTGAPAQLMAESGLEVNTLTTSGQVSDLFLSQNNGQWVLQELGLNGEPRPGREVNVSIYRPEFSNAVELQMKTDATGSIALGALEGVSTVNATHADGVERGFTLPQPQHTLPAIIHLRAGEALRFPWALGRAPLAGEVALINQTGPISLISDYPAPAPANGYLTWKDLPAGTYTLHAAGAQHTVRVAPGDPVEGHALTTASTVQLSAHRPLTVTGFAEGEAKLPDGKTDPVLVFHIGGGRVETRVHVMASRFLPEFDAFSSLRGESPAPSATRPAWQPSVYLSTRNIGDEYRYVLDRRTAARFAGNMLARPGLLINPWEIAVTEAEKEKLQDLEKAAEGELLPKPSAPMTVADPFAAPAGEAEPGSFPQTPTTPPPGKPDLSFLATPGPVALNLKPDAKGNVVIPRAALGDRQYVRVVALDGESSAVRDFSIAGAALPPRDLRLARQLNPALHFSQQNRVTLLTKDAPFRFDDALAAQFQALGHLGAVHQLFLNLTQNPQLAEFSWLLEWKTFDDAKKRQLYSQYACHELSFFLSRKDRPFFDAVIKPYLASKHDKTFLDHYLLGTDLTRYLAPWPYGQLNTLERLLLAERLQADQPAARRSVQDWLNNQAPNPQRDLFLFETALRGRALMTNQGSADGRIAGNNHWDDNGRADWYFDANSSPVRLDYGIPFDGVINGNGEVRFELPANGAAFGGGRPEILTQNLELTEEETVKLQAWEEQSGSGNAEVRKFYTKALGYAELGQFSEAQAELGRVLAVEPNNPAARRTLEQLEQQSADYTNSARDHTRLKMLNGVDQLSDTPRTNSTEDYIEGRIGDVERKFLGGAQNLRGFKYREFKAESEPGSPNDSPRDPVATGDFDAEITLNKANSIILDKAKFENASVEEVMAYLRKESMKADNIETDPDKKGVDFVLRGTEGAKSVTLDLTNVKLIDAVRAVSEVAGVKFDIQPDGVVIFPATGGSITLTTRQFRVPSDFLTRAAEVADDPASPADPFAIPGTPTLAKRPTARSVLESLGVTIPEGGSASFDPTTGRLIVKAPYDQLDLVESLSESMSIDGRDIDNDGFTNDTEYLGRLKSRDLSERARLFRQQDPTKVWAEQNYYRLPIEQQTAGLVPVNRFWRDYALWDGKTAFVSTNVADAAGTFAEMVLALAVLDLPFPGDFQSGKAETKDNVLTLTPAGPGVLFHQDILPAEVDKDGAKLLVSQNFYREGDRYIEEGGEKSDKFVSAEFLTGAVYGCQVVVTNPSSSRQRLDVLFQIPAGALPVKATRRVQSLPVMIEPYRTQTLDFHFYFPEAGKFAHFPVHISRGEKTAASAPAFTFNVVARPTINDPASWDYVSQHGTDKEVLSFLEQNNLYFLDLEQVLWRLKDADFFRAVITLLKARHHYDEGVWSYAALHNVQPFLHEYLQESALSTKCGPVFESELLTLDPVERKSYQHLEYSPLINARAHSLGGERRILNDKFAVQWNALMTVLAWQKALGAEDQLAVAGYLAAQDRIEEALAAFARVERAAVAEKLQYEYLRAWLAMRQEDTATARKIASALVAHPVKHWREKFAILTSQLDELEGKPNAAADIADRDAAQEAAADKEASLALTVEGKVVKVNYRNLADVTVRYYPVDLEFLFSANPFLTSSTARFGNIRPAASEKHMLPANAEAFNVALPARFHSQSVLVEIAGGGTVKSVPVYAHDLEVQVSGSFGQLTVQHAGKPLAKTYVKVFADVNGTPVFYKDGYTDLRGKFDYASLSTDDLNGARRFAILVQSEEHGALVQEVKPPAR